MSFNWSSYLELADFILNKIDDFPDDEAVCRSVISRAYYAMFCLARNYVRDTDNHEFHGNDHKKLQVYLKGDPDKIRKKLGHQLEALHQERIKADYYDSLDEKPINKAQKALASAKRIKASLDMLP